MISKNSLSQLEDDFHQKFVNKYFGNEGFLKIGDETEINCKFEAGQLENGKIILICDCSILDLKISDYFPKLDEHIPHLKPDFNLENCTTDELETILKLFIRCSNSPNYCLSLCSRLNNIKSFEGTTSDNLIITGKIKLLKKIENNPLPNTDIRVKFEFSMMELTVNTGVKEELKCIDFGITDFIFGSKPDDILPLNIEGTKKLTIKKVQNYEEIKDYLEKIQGIHVTSEIRIESNSEAEIKDLEKIVEDLCDIISISMGTRIQWIYCYAFNLNGQITSWKHVSRVTKPYSIIEIIPSEKLNILGNYIESSYIALSDKSNMLRYGEKTAKPLVNAYLEAKAGNDYLEGRGIKLAVVLEMLKDTYLKSKPSLEYIIEKENFKKIHEDTKKDLNKNLMQSTFSKDIDIKKRKMFYKNLSGINRTPFQDILTQLCESIHVDPIDLQLVVDSRDSLIHTGQFLCKSGRKETPRFQNSRDEYFFLVNFTDKCFLKLLGYKGEYLDWRNFDNVRSEILP